MTAVVDRTQFRPAPVAIGQAVWRALIDTIVVFTLLGWLYAAVIAVFDPDGLSLAVLTWLPVRRDTMGAFCFAVSIIAYFIRQISHRSVAMTDMRSARGRAEAAVLRTIFIYSSLLLVYLMANTITHRETMDLPLTHFLRSPTEEQVLLAALLCSASSFFIVKAQSHMLRLSEGTGR